MLQLFQCNGIDLHTLQQAVAVNYTITCMQLYSLFVWLEPPVSFYAEITEIRQSCRKSEIKQCDPSCQHHLEAHPMSQHAPSDSLIELFIPLLCNSGRCCQIWEADKRFDGLEESNERRGIRVQMLI